MTNRPIRFRAWCTKQQEMYDSFSLAEAINEKGSKWHEGQDIFMQYTGLKDKNGTPIYEGDILSGSQLRIVEWFAHGWKIKVRTPKGDRWYDPFRKSDMVENSIGSIVIGNIYENPELLAPVINEKK